MVSERNQTLYPLQENMGSPVHPKHKNILLCKSHHIVIEIYTFDRPLIGL
jgi:hypothetical protein